MKKIVDIKLSAEELEGTEATLSKWLYNVGDTIKSGQPIVELETDKVSMEICAPASGLLNDIIVTVGHKVVPEDILATLIEQTDVSEGSVAFDSDSETTKPETSKISPAVRRILKQHNLDVNDTIHCIQGSGNNGRVTRKDVERYLDQAEPLELLEPTVQPITSPAIRTTTQSTNQGEIIPHSAMRKTIANHMVNSLLRTAPHVTSVFEMDMSNIIEHRKWHKKEYLEDQTHLTYTAYFLLAACEAIQVVPKMNARYHDDGLELLSDINIGIGTALGDKGLVVPVINNVQTMKLFEIAQHLTEQTNKARSGTLKTNDMNNGTFTISNHGVSGSLFAAPIIINQPEIAILGIGKLEKRTVVVDINGEDVITIKPMCYVTLTIDHRALDAYQANLFLSTFVEKIEHWGE